MKSLGMSLKEIQLIFEVKRKSGCSSPELLESVIFHLSQKQDYFQTQEKLMREKRQQTEVLIQSLNRYVSPKHEL